MSDHGHHDPGGHELEAVNTKLLFRLLISLSFITLLACVVVVQWFYSQRRELDAQYAAEGSTFLLEYKAKMAKDLEGIDRVAQDVAGNPSLLVAPPPPSGWMHPDDLVAGVVAAPADEPAGDAHGAEEHDVEAPVPVEPPEGDAEGEPAEDDGDVEDDAAPEPAEPKPADAEKPAKPADGDDAEKPAKPAQPAKPAEDEAKPADPKPADDGE
ncbi:hypothetical protein DB30_06056 [Enhygromyxa salina]|uniref:Uncharacterized protein n=1 Tax=Enhygromyxa salina TaxID=215803 RepID=A0A0C1ZBD9_9BACT|nr:hypothetical protein [Enhygromyxa salina]KIG15024.1 hypothetical protein DB30_06056 [Enhygromyxa salina]